MTVTDTNGQQSQPDPAAAPSPAADQPVGPQLTPSEEAEVDDKLLSSVVPDSPSVRDLHQAYLEPGRPRFQELRKAFKAENGKIVEEFYASASMRAAVIVVCKHSWLRRWRNKFEIIMYN